MASAVDICNTALSHLGDAAEVAAITPPDGTVQAALCARWYPIARDAVLEMHNWTFATKRVDLAPLAPATMPVEWGYCYARPTCIKVRSVHFPDEIPSSPSGAIFNPDDFSVMTPPAHPFEEEALDDGTLVIYTNVEQATARLTAQITDTTKFTPLFSTAVARYLAALLAGPIYKGKTGREMAASQMEWFEKIDLPRAKAANASVGYTDIFDNFIPSSHKARR